MSRRSPAYRLKRKVLEALGDLYCATPRDLAQFIRNRPPTESDIRTVRRTLQILQDDPKISYIKSKPFHDTDIYGLTDSGARFVRDKGIEEARDFDIKDLDHEEYLTLIIISLRNYFGSLGFQLKWKRPVVNYDLIINPDLILTVLAPDWKYTFTLEVERQSLNESYLKKAKKYQSVFDQDEAVRLFGARKFRVLFIVETDRKRENLAEKLRMTDYNHKMFWNATILDMCGNPGDSIFKTPKDFEQRSYAFLDTFPK